MNINFSPYNIKGTPFREGQEEIIQKMVDFFNDPSKKALVFEGNTGIGKSLIALTVAEYLNQVQNCVSFVTTPLNQLLDQYERDGLFVFKGKSNYTCAWDETFKVSNAPCNASKTFKCPIREKCHYYRYLQQAQRTPILGTNFHVLLISQLYTKVFTKRDLLIVDEAHSLESALVDFYNASFTEYHMKFISKLLQHFCVNDLDNCFYGYAEANKLVPTTPAELSEIQQLLVGSPEQLKNTEYIKRVFNKVIDVLSSFEELYASIKDNFDLEALSNKESKDLADFNDDLKEVGELKEKLELFVLNATTYKWVCSPHIVEKTKTIYGVEIKPLHINTLATEFFEKAADKIIFMSATIGPKPQFCKDIGLDQSTTVFVDSTSSFPAEHRPIILREVGMASYDCMDDYMTKAIKEIDKILDEFPNYKGIIHTSNSTQCKQLIAKSKHIARLRTHDRGDRDGKKYVLDLFMKSKSPLVLCSPSMKEGLDLKDDLCRLQIILKVPWGNTSDPYINAKKEDDKGWYMATTAKALEQSTGRGVRSKDDWCITFILDGTIRRLIQYNHGEVISEYLRDGLIAGSDPMAIKKLPPKQELKEETPSLLEVNIL